ncbi:MAG: hypothetical protein ACI9QC_000678 [Oceanicoccus sp.]|jgi:hypothetical protein
MREVVFTRVVMPVCPAFEERFAKANLVSYKGVTLRWLEADRENRVLFLLREEFKDIIVKVTEKSPRSGVIQNGRFSGCVVRQITRDGEFFLARPVVGNKITGSYVDDTFWDLEFSQRKKERSLGETVLLDLGPRVF